MSTNPKLSLIVAKSRNNVIGRDGDLPWRLSSDLQFFKATTMGKPVLMGRVTWESLPFPLPGRPNLVLTRDANYSAPKAEVFTDLHDMIGRGYELAGLTGTDEIMLIGGAQLYARLLPFCDRLYITDVDAVIDGDAHFPAISAFDWQLSRETNVPQGEKDDYPFTIRVYDKKTAQ
ncbi:dihydrofolate reductase [Litorimonas sp. RW-G-Af-16]|uniref:dihydrofolate reductase n=1 Tax=Litorimonas sp. RW-G-Af-16 TaxID=3241168 RepID=UPI00390CCE83